MKLDDRSLAMRELLENLPVAGGPQIALALKPMHERVVDALADAALEEIREMSRRAREESDQRFKQILSFHQRSIAQRRRFWRMRTLQERTA